MQNSHEEIEPEINLQLSAYIPADYIPDISQRYITYRRIAALATSPPDIHEDLQDELKDRYGDIPEETTNLFKIVAIKKELAELRINKLEKGRDTLVLHFLSDTPLAPDMLLKFIQLHSKSRKSTPPRITPDGKLILSGKISSTEETFAKLSKTLHDLNTLAHAS